MHKHEMKTLFLAIIPFFLLLSFSPKPSSSLSSAINDDPVVDINDDLLRNQPRQYPLAEPVLDDKGLVLQPDKPYYILVAENQLFFDHGLKPCHDKKICKPVVVPDDFNNKYGTALKFSPKSNSGKCKQHIEFSCELRIEFMDEIPQCSGKTVWEKASKNDRQTQQRYIELTASKDQSYWFRFVQDVKPFTYRIIYFNNNNPFNVSHFPKDDGPGFLALSNDLHPLVVKFRQIGDVKEKPLNPDGSNISTEMPTVLAVA